MANKRKSVSIKKPLASGDRVRFKNANGEYTATVIRQIPAHASWAVKIDSGPNMVGWTNVEVPSRMIIRL